MIFYVIIATFFFLGFFVPNKIQNIYYKLSIFILFLFTAFRDINLGGYDTDNYKFFFSQLPLLADIISYKSRFAYGYTIFNSIVKTLNNDYRFYQVVYSILSIVLLSLVIKKLELRKKEKNLFLFVYFCYRYIWNTFVLLRQNIAMLIIWIILLTIFDKSFKYYFGVVVSWLWHKTSIVNILIYPILKCMKKIKRKKMLLITCIISIILLIFSKPVFNYLIKIFVIFAGNEYSKYFWESSDNKGINFINYFIRWFFVLIFYFNYKRITNTKKEILLNISFFVLMISSINTGIAGRLVEYYMVSIYAIITINYQAFKGRDKYVYLMGIYVVFIIILVRFLYTFSGGELLNYSTFVF